MAIDRSTIATKGFTLLELAIVISIIGIITAMGISASITFVEAAKQASTENKLNTIEDALFTFSRTYGRLPCPALANAETGTEGACTAVASAVFASSTTNKAIEGVVPFATLGLPKEFMYDGWGRKIAYAITPAFSATHAFRTIKVDTVCSTAITITDAAGGTRSSNAAYALVSFGPNGHGGFLQAGTRMNAGSTNTQEQTNCHCSSTAVDSGAYNGNYVQRDPELDTSTAADYFDDIVRFKERSQLASQEDTMNDSGYRGPTLAVGFSKTGSAGSIYSYKPNCSGWTSQTALSPTPTIDTGNSAVAFTAHNQYLLTYSTAGCGLYKISGTSAPVSLSSPVSGCSYHAQGTLALSNNGYLAVSPNSTTVSLWKHAGDSFSALSPSSLTVSTAPTSLSFSRNADYLANGADGKIYIRKGNSFSVLGAGTPTGMPASPTSVAFSPDGKYYAAVKTGTIYLWRVPTNDKPAITDFIALSSLTPAGSTSLSGVTFSQDGQYMAVGRAETPYLLIYKIDPYDVFTLATVVSTGIPSASTGLGFSFSADSNYLAMRTAHTNLPVALFRRTGVLEYTYMASPLSASVSGSTGSSVAFAH